MSPRRQRTEQEVNMMVIYREINDSTEVQGRLFLDVIVQKDSAVLKLLPRKDEMLVVRWNAISQ